MTIYEDAPLPSTKCYECGRNIDWFNNYVRDMVYYAVRVSNVPGRMYESVPMCNNECADKHDNSLKIKENDK
jgi:hypothetical protein